MGNRLSDWRALKKTWGAIEPPFKNRARIIQLVVQLLSPFRAYEQWRLRHALPQHSIHESPLFILGHWRSGTTLLHSLIAKDTNFGYLTNLQGLFPHAFMTNALVPFLARHLMPPTRPMDTIRIDPHTPQEEELALISYGIYSLYHMWSFPKSWESIFRQTVAFEQPGQEQAWQHAYMALLQKVSLYHKGKPLVLKNPANTARIPTLIKLFPRARFIHIRRNPVEVYGSTIKLHTRVIPYFQLQDFTSATVEQMTLFLYRELMQRYLRDKALIPDGQLLEIDYPALTQDPVAQLNRIYDYFELPGKQEMDKRVKTYFHANPRPPKKDYQFPEKLLTTLRKEWAFLPAEWWEGAVRE